MNEFLDYDDKLEIEHEFGNPVYNRLYGNVSSGDGSYEQRQDDSEECRFWNE